MSRPFPYTYISCPCADTPIPDPSRKRRSRESPQKGKAEQTAPLRAEDSDDEEQTFDPRSPRSNFSLYPPEQLLYCEDCHQIKCPRCITEETSSSAIRCARNCFNCPACTAPLAVTTLENVTGGESQQGPWVLSCAYCMWTTLDIGIKFDKPTNIRTQLSKMTDPSSRGRQMSKTVGELKSPLSIYSSVDDQFPTPEESRDGQSTTSNEQPAAPLNFDARFSALKAFYKDQIAATSTSPADPFGADFGPGFASPGALNRIMSLYAASSRLNNLYGANKKPKSKPPVMREALTTSEGLKVPAPDTEETIIERMASEDCGWDGVASIEQRMFQSPDARFVEDLLPLPVLLRTKRSKRCKSCKHILVKPEFKPQSTRFRIRLIALSYIPLPTLKPLPLGPATGLPSTSSTTSLGGPNLDALSPLKPIQLLLTLKNHMFDPVRVTLATPSVTPGRVATKVTILCPQFDIGANSDVWDEALQGTAAGDQRSSRSGGFNLGSEKVAEAGKVWDKGRNWTTVVLEVVPGTLPGGTTGARKQRAHDVDSDDSDDQNSDSDNDENNGKPATKLDWSGKASDPRNQLQPDEDVLEIPVFVRMEWDSENQMEQSVSKSQGSDTVKRELAYWMVLGVGRITGDFAP
ncbi:putative dynactin Arp1 p62 subunit RO2 [Aspergillus clavatus NRRL 1]|uniref:Dynactin subunit 4 n=1 Tax=Aspergillus clavatus (strain ATCC 1007 / CBS 513.65 / DSM 816 / NCTC 3887 / NRRL 1 / QM 1276 / 107) TaxID=344612 RepID=A1CKH6_ASPCL|nr:dynactin Arp1 p62 subunit RO2, putative [Aspergillus clavatus NRRL 1]EAW09650.1 dynactin Arp1 p62 subunit RO2, putative [Aspergillus clavatus NRRL 1]